MDRVTLHGLCDVLEVLSAELAIGYVKLAFDLVEHLARNADAATIGDALETSRDIDPIAEDIGPFGDDVAKIDADAKFNALVQRYFRITLEHAALNRDRTSDGVNDAAEFSENAVARRVCDVPAMHLDRGIQDLAPVGPQPRQRTHLVVAH